MDSSQKCLFLFSVDVEDFPVIKDGQPGWAGNMNTLLDRYTKFLDDRKMKGTFFVLGEVAEKHPELIRSLVEKGHEVGCHGHTHIPLTKHTPDTFKADIRQALSALKNAGVTQVAGYRAPFLSITPETAWAYDILKEFGFRYSSSVLPRFNPLHSWPNFGERPKMIKGLWELPVTVVPGFPMGIPAAAGVYFRTMPQWMLKKIFLGFAEKKQPILSYFHPYDVDHDSESRTCTWLKNNPVGNFFIFYNRKNLLRRLAKVTQNQFKIIPYCDYLNASLIES